MAFATFRKRTYTLAGLARHARALVARSRGAVAIWRGRVDPALRERIMLSVARANGCRYCCYVHAQWAQLEGASDEELARLDGLDPGSFDRDEWLAMSYAVELAETDFTDTGSDLGREVERRSGRQRRDDVETIARAMTFANLMANTLDAFVNRLKGNPDPEGRVFDEVVIAAVLVLTGPFSVIALAAILKMSPVRFVREMLRLQLSATEEAA